MKPCRPSGGETIARRDGHDNRAVLDERKLPFLPWCSDLWKAFRRFLRHGEQPTTVGIGDPEPGTESARATWALWCVGC